MPDFEEFDRELALLAARDQSDSASEVAARIHALGDPKLPPLFRNRSTSELEAYLLRAKSALDSHGELWLSGDDFPGTWVDVSSGIPGLMFILKSDEEPLDFNVGIGAVARAFDPEVARGPDPSVEEELREIMGGKGIERRRRMGVRNVLEGRVPSSPGKSHEVSIPPTGSLNKEKKSVLDELTGFFDRLNSPGQEGSSDLDAFAILASLGIAYTSSNFEYDAIDDAAELVCLKYDWDEGLIENENAFDAGDKIVYGGVRVERGELSVILENGKGLNLLISPCFKGSWRDEESGIEVPASYWVNGASFNVTLERDGRRV